MKKKKVKLAVILLATVIVAVSAMTVNAETENTIPNGAVDATEAYSHVNFFRSLHNIKVKKSQRVKGLKRNRKLESVALIRAREMAMTDTLSHTRPNGKSCLTLIKKGTYKAENIAEGQWTCFDVSMLWITSPPHRKNMLNKKYKKVGIAGYVYNGKIYWAQVFSS